MADSIKLSLSSYVNVFMPSLLEDEKSSRFNSYPPAAMAALKALRNAENALENPDISTRERLELEGEATQAETILTSARRNLIESSYKLWTKAQEADLPVIVLGSSELREPGPLRENFKDLTHEKPDRGSILVTNEWALILNDGMLLGTYLAGKDCAISLPTGFPKSADVCNPSGPRVFLREMAMLKALGYEQVTPEEDVPKVGMLFKLPCYRNPTYMSFKTQRAWERFCKLALIKMRFAAAMTTTVAAAKALFSGWGSPQGKHPTSP